MKITSQSVTLLRTSHESFTGNDGSKVEYDKAVLLDDDGNKFEMAIDKEASASVMALEEKTDGVAELEAFVARKGNGSQIKFRLLGFKRGK